MTAQAMDLEAFLSKGGSVCPFAVRSARIYATVGIEPRLDRPRLRSAAKSFSETRGQTPNGTLLVLQRVDATRRPSDFEHTKTWAREVFLELMTCFGLVSGASEAELTPAIGQVRAMLFDEHEPRRPMLGCGAEPLFAICMSPLYPATHPRYAPHAVVVVTWQADVAAVHDLPAREHIRRAMVREHGVVYDADDLMLHFLPSGPEPRRQRQARCTSVIRRVEHFSCRSRRPDRTTPKPSERTGA